VQPLHAKTRGREEQQLQEQEELQLRELGLWELQLWELQLWELGLWELGLWEAYLVRGLSILNSLLVNVLRSGSPGKGDFMQAASAALSKRKANGPLPGRHQSPLLHLMA
jgi:hypothetical protein